MNISKTELMSLVVDQNDLLKFFEVFTKRGSVYNFH